MVKKLESSIKYRLEKLGLETGGRPIEVKVRHTVLFTFWVPTSQLINEPGFLKTTPEKILFLDSFFYKLQPNMFVS